MFEYTACSIKGKERKKNEDRVLVNMHKLADGSIDGKQKESILAVVCDGVGSTRGGEIAAEMIVNSFCGYDIKMTSPQSVTRHIHKVNHEIIDKQKHNCALCDMASTLAGIIIYEKHFILFNLGDTRIYKLFNGELACVSRDHTTTLFTDGHTKSVNNTAITSYLGGDGCSCFPSIRRGLADLGVVFMVCSDGIYKKIREEELKRILEGDNTITEKKEAILNLALQNGSVDDMSMVLIKSVS